MAITGTPVASTPAASTITLADDILPYIQTQFEQSAMTVANTKLIQSLKSCLVELSNRDLLQRNATGAETIDNTIFSIAVPTRSRVILSIQLTDSGGNKINPLIPLKGGKEAYDYWMSEDGGRGEPRWYTEYANKIYLYSPPNGTFTYTIDYLANHANSTTIEFSDNFLDVIQKGTAFYMSQFKLNQKYREFTAPLYAVSLQMIEGQIVQEV